MIDSLGILDIFEYKGVQGFVHTDFSVSTIMKLPEFTNIDIMTDIERNNYEIEKERIFNSMSVYGPGAFGIPPAPNIGGTMYQIINSSNPDIEEELEIIRNSNKSKELFGVLLDKIIVEEEEKLNKYRKNLNKSNNYIIARTYMSEKEEKAFVFTYEKKKYKIKNFVELYKKHKLPNNKESEFLKEDLYNALKPLFSKHFNSLRTFGVTSVSETPPFDMKLKEKVRYSRGLDILGQVNVLREFLNLSKLESIDINKNVNLQIFDSDLEFKPDYTQIDTKRHKYEIYDRDDRLEYVVYEDEFKNVVVKAELENFEQVFQNCYIKIDDGGIIENEKGIYVLQSRTQATRSEQVSLYFLESSGYTIRKAKLYKYIRVYAVNQIPDTIDPNTGEYLFVKLNELFSNSAIKFNITINTSKAPNEEMKKRLSMLRRGWGIINTLPNFKDIFYEKDSVLEKVEAYSVALEMVRRAEVTFQESQMFITSVSYSPESNFGELNNIMQSTEFGFGVVEEAHLASVILFSSCMPLAYGKKTKEFDKEMMFTDVDLVNLLSLNSGVGDFSLAEPKLIGISNNSKINFINTYDPRIEAPNGIVIGSTGSGKSFTKSFELIKLLTLGEMPFIGIIDRGGSFINLVKIFGGKAVTLNLQDTANNINPFIYTDNFRKIINQLETRNNSMGEDIVITKEYKTKTGKTIFETDMGELLILDENNNYQSYLMEEVSPQTKLGFFNRIVLSMCKSKKADISTIITSILKDIIINNEQKFKSKEFLKEETIILTTEDISNEKDITDKFSFNSNEIKLKETLDEDGKVNVITSTFTFIEEEEGVLVKYNEIVGKEEFYPKAKIYTSFKGQFHNKETYYFTTKTVQDKMRELDQEALKEEINILNSYIDLNVYGNLFEGPPKLNFDSELLWTVDMGEETPDDLSGVILQALNIILWASILHPQNKSRKKMVIYDEVHHILSNKEDTGAASAISYMYRTIRKHGGGIHILSQASSDILKKETEVTPEQANIFSGIKANAMYKYVIGINADDARRTQEDLQLTEQEVKGIVDFSENKTKIPALRGLIYLKTKAFKGFINIESTPIIYAIATTKKEEKNLLEAIEKELKDNDALNNFIKESNLTKDEITNVITIIKIIIFSKVFPKGINNSYGENSEGTFINKHIASQKDGSDRFREGFREYLLQNNKTDLVDAIINVEIMNFQKILK